ncbi:hypothetical protein LWI28_018365 [Acer negundo]|uniref:PA domain-containing protein n=1 Tax=Acer negundo TaxID=4023 RepID=A0AAD5J514_ACENE|nr:hypothetical protein LWI28_018365 [Acer negundo]
MATAAVASIDEQAYIIHMDKNKVAANYREFYQALMDSVNKISSQDEDEDQETSSPQLLYVYETAISGSSLYYGKATKQLQVVYAKTAGSGGAEYCMDGTLDQKLVKGKIVVCQRGINGRAKKGEIVKLAKGAGMLLVNNKNEGEELFADPHILPAAALGASAGETIKKYTNSTKKPTASIVFKGTVFGKTAPVMAAFSSRGPIKVEQPNGVLVTVKPKILSFKKLGQKLSYKVTFVGLRGSTGASSNSSFGSLTWVYGKYVVRSPIAAIWQ